MGWKAKKPFGGSRSVFQQILGRTPGANPQFKPTPNPPEPPTEQPSFSWSDINNITKEFQRLPDETDEAYKARVAKLKLPLTPVEQENSVFKITGDLPEDEANLRTLLTDVNNALVKDPTNTQLLSAKHQAESKLFGITSKRQITEFGTGFDTRSAEYRKRLVDSLAKTGEGTFELANPYILQDLNARGLFSSSTAVNEGQAEALKEIALANQGTLTDFDTGVFGQKENILGQALTAQLGGNQQALDTSLNFDVGGLNRSYQLADQAKYESMVRWLAKQKRRGDIINSIIGASGQVFGGSLTGGGGGSGNVATTALATT